MHVGNSGAQPLAGQDASWMKLVTSTVRRLCRGADTEDPRAGLSRVELLSEREAGYIPDGDFVSASFDVDSKQNPSRMVVLLSTPRSGSTYLCDLLHRADFCTAHEYFQPEQYLPLLAYRWGCVDRGRLSWPRYARALESHRTSQTGVLGINVHGTHLHRFDEALPEFSASEVDYLWLQRCDKLRQAVSLSIARQTGQWSSLFKARAVPRYDRSLILKSLRTIHAEEDLIAAYLHARGISCTTIYYEDVARAPGAVLRSALGIEIGKSARNGIALRPQGGPRNDAWASKLGSDMFFGPDAEERSARAQPAVPCAPEQRLIQVARRTNVGSR